MVHLNVAKDEKLTVSDNEFQNNDFLNHSKCSK